MEMFSYNLKLGNSIKILIAPIVAVTVFIILLFLFVPRGISGINEKLKEYESAHSKEVLLSDKLDSLKKISITSLDPQDITVVAMPSNNPVVWVISNMRRLSEEYGVEVGGISVGRQGVGGADKILSSVIDFECRAESMEAFLSFVDDLTKTLPITSLDAVTVNKKSGTDVNVFEGKVSLEVYWSEFPTTLPALTQPVNELTNEDLNLIGAVSRYESLSFVDLLPSEPVDRAQPFN